MYITCSSLGKNGNFGNQLFQYAAVLGLAAKHNLIPILPKCQLSDCFNISDNLEYPEDKYKELLSQFKKVGLIKEQTYHYDTNIDESIRSAVSQKYDCIDILGYFQTSKYFQYKDLHLNGHLEFLPDTTNDGNSFLINNGMVWEPENFVGIHVRRGDYLQLSDYHPPLDINYYRKAIFNMQNESTKFVVVSDDIEWCKTNLVPLAPNNQWLFPNFNKYNDFYCLTLCSKIIIANSTFSWWAAYLGKNMFLDSELPVCAPHNWFGPKLRNNTKDLYEKGWMII